MFLICLRHLVAHILDFIIRQYTESVVLALVVIALHAHLNSLMWVNYYRIVLVSVFVTVLLYMMLMAMLNVLIACITTPVILLVVLFGLMVFYIVPVAGGVKTHLHGVYIRISTLLRIT
ncbi:MAG: hypothetical protein DRH06_08485 [Deltaproteobacteria bacterium]|nr:MAG: hypothetical protein DRH06_08485 [Deltaproteobacteria bacterium]